MVKETYACVCLACLRLLAVATATTSVAELIEAGAICRLAHNAEGPGHDEDCQDDDVVFVQHGRSNLQVSIMVPMTQPNKLKQQSPNDVDANSTLPSREAIAASGAVPAGVAANSTPVSIHSFDARFSPLPTSALLVGRSSSNNISDAISLHSFFMNIFPSHSFFVVTVGYVFACILGLTLLSSLVLLFFIAWLGPMQMCNTPGTSLGCRCRLGLMVVVSCCGCLALGLDIGSTAPILESSYFKRDVGHMDNWKDPASAISGWSQGNITAMFSLGCIVACFPPLLTYFADGWGRRSTIIMGAIIHIFGCGLQASANDLRLLLCGRFASGLAAGVFSSIVVLYLVEISPARFRGTLTPCSQLSITFGIFSSACLGCGFVEQEGGWRQARWMSMAPSFLVLAIMPFLPNSPRWLVQRGHLEEALQALSFTRAEEEAQEEYNDILSAHKASQDEGSCNKLASGLPARLLFISVTLMMLANLMGLNAIMYYGPQIFERIGLGDHQQFWNVITTGVNFIATLPSLKLADSVGRRPLLIWGAVGQSICSLCLGVFDVFGFVSHLNEGANHTQRQAAYFLLVVIVAFKICFAMTWGAVGSLYATEIFSTQNRAFGTACCGLSRFVGNWVIAMFTPIMLDTINMKTFLVFSIFGGMSVWLAVLLPETKNVKLEDMDAMFEARFGRANYFRCFWHITVSKHAS